jgi:hypothetical protein
MVGFGAAITDASAWLIQTRMNAVQRAALMLELFGPRSRTPDQLYATDDRRVGLLPHSFQL